VDSLLIWAIKHTYCINVWKIPPSSNPPEGGIMAILFEGKKLLKGGMEKEENVKENGRGRIKMELTVFQKDVK
jgi:hypothetical protein